MELRDRRTLEKELNELKKSYREILNSNVKLSDELRWAKEDRERLNRRIDRAIELLNYNYNSRFIEEDINYIGEGCYNNLLKILKNDFWEDDE